MTPEEKIDAIHDTVTWIKADLAARTTICENTHKTVDGRLEGLHRVLKGNGQPGLEQKHAELATRFDKFETRVIAYSVAAIIAVQLLIPKLESVLGWLK